MATRWTKTLNLKDNLKDILKIAEALANETRLEILQALKDHREINHTELAKLIDKSPATVSSHMKYLVRAGILEDVKLKGLRGRIKKVPRFLINEIMIIL
ncbi:hypothetical protein LCGC14_0912640 [marine sediment metagenome]|uniref:HTH arsR-type domain-containing protein n=1 Tax=marine sediment metagenome TaxID=412755 RepID=A0A0F9RC05_9ZZZZ